MENDLENAAKAAAIFAEKMYASFVPNDQARNIDIHQAHAAAEALEAAANAIRALKGK